jgi:hypothetical protein
MGGLFWPALGLAALGFFSYRAWRVWVDAGQREFSVARRAGWTLLGAVVPSHYWWGARIEALSSEEQAELLVHETAALRLSHADSLRCPLCDAEVPRVWALAPGGRPIVAPGPVKCPRCDFRLDCCRHCIHFLPGKPPAWGEFGPISADVTYGRCGHYGAPQPVEQAYPSEVARQLKARGYERIRAPLPIVDSFVPPDFCTAFTPDRTRLKASKVRWPDARRVALLRLLALPPSPEARATEKPPSVDERWLL